MATLTEIDRLQNYEEEGLADAVNSDDACRHAARVAHLYLARSKLLSNEDYSKWLPKLFDKLLGCCEDVQRIPKMSNDLEIMGWMAKLKDISFAMDGRSLDEWLTSNLSLTFVDKTKTENKGRGFSKNVLDCFRTYQLTFFLFERLAWKENRSCVYYMPVRMFPSYIVDQIRAAFEGINTLPSSTQLPDFYVNLRYLLDRSKYSPGFLALDPQETYIIRFLSWFVFCQDRDPTRVPALHRPIPAGQTGLARRIDILSPGKAGFDGSLNKNSSAFSKSFIDLTLEDLNFYHLRRKYPVDELLMRCLEAFIPLSDSDASMTSTGLLLFNGMIHLWLLRNKPSDVVNTKIGTTQMSASNSLIEVQSHGSVMYTADKQLAAKVTKDSSSLLARADSTASSGYLAPTSELLRGILVLVTYLQTDPDLTVGYPVFQPGHDVSMSSRANEVALAEISAAKLVRNMKTMQLWGLSAFLRVIRRPLYDFFTRSCQYTPRQTCPQSPGWLPVVKLWLSCLHPWKAHARWYKRKDNSLGLMASLTSRTTKVSPKVAAERQEKVTSDTSVQDSGLMGTVRKLNASFTALVGNSGAEEYSNGANSGLPKSPGLSSTATSPKNLKTIDTDDFTPEWLWFVVQNYLLYAKILQIALAGFRDATLNLPDMSVLAFAFGNAESGPFCDAVISILRACEIIIEDDELNLAPRKLVDEISTCFDELAISKKSYLGHKKSYSNEISARKIRLVLDCMDRERELVTLMLRNQFKELDWDIRTDLIPSILDSSKCMQSLLRQMRRSSDLKSVSGGHSLGQTSRWGIELFSGGKISPEKVAIQRLHGIFKIPYHLTDDIGSAGTRAPFGSTEWSKEFTDASYRVAIGSPSWLGNSMICAYRRLSTIGRERLKNGAPVNNIDHIAYIGDALSNPPPVCSYELRPLVILFHSMSVNLNELFNLYRIKYNLRDTDLDGVDVGFRIQLRILADVRFLFFLTILMIISESFLLGPRINPYLWLIGVLLAVRSCTVDNIQVLKALLLTLPIFLLVTSFSPE